MVDFLRRTPPFSDLTDMQRQWLCDQSGDLHLPAGEALFHEGDMPTCLHIVLDGGLQITKRVEGQDTEIDLLTPGMFTGDIGLFIGLPHIATAHAMRPTHLLQFGVETFQALIAHSPTVARAMLPLMGARVQGAEVLVREREQLAALGKLSAGLAHELNNPAAAGQRAAAQLRETFAALQERTRALMDMRLSPEAWAALTALGEEARTPHPPLAPLDQRAREDAVAAWLDTHAVPDGWDLAPALVSAGVTMARLNALADALDPAAVGPVVGWLADTITADSLVRDIGQSTARITELVRAVKNYSRMDEAPQGDVDVREGLDSTLTMLGHKLRAAAITVTREYDADLPRIVAYGSELNQVWTNLIDNAIDAMSAVGVAGVAGVTGATNGGGTLLLHATADGDAVRVEVVDNGPGIPPEVAERIFQPFFTTKAQGKGTGLGLDISYRIVVNRHGGDLHVVSHPGETRMQVRLPLHPAR